MGTETMSQRFWDAILTVLPTCVFVFINAKGSLRMALVGTTVTATLILLLKIFRRARIFHAGVGCMLAAAGAAIAIFTGEARGYFLLPTFIPVICALVFFGSIVGRCPLTGLIINPLVKGPADWYNQSYLRRLYTCTTLVAIGINVVSALLQRSFYINNQTELLAFIHIASVPVFGTLLATTFVLASAQIRAQKKASEKALY